MNHTRGVRKEPGITSVVPDLDLRFLYSILHPFFELNINCDVRYLRYFLQNESEVDEVVVSFKAAIESKTSEGLREYFITNKKQNK